MLTRDSRSASARRNRFKVAPKEQRTLDGLEFASKREMMRYAHLKQAQRAGLICDLELQPAFPVMIGGHKFCTYTADFRYFDVATRLFEIEEVKSSGTAKDAAYRLRKKAAELYYGIKVKLIIE